MSLEDNARQAREAGLSYGKYMARYGKTPEQVTSEAEARKLGGADRVIRRSYAHAEHRGGAGKACCCMNCGATFSTKRPKKFCSRFCYLEYYRRRAYEREGEKQTDKMPGSIPVNLDRLREEMDRRELTYKKNGGIGRLRKNNNWPHHVRQRGALANSGKAGQRPGD